MTTERVTQEQAREALANVRDDGCRCHEGYKSRGLIDPYCNHDTAEYVATLERFIAQHPDDPSAECASEHAEAVARVERPTLYDWSDPRIPPRATCIATDGDGCVFFFFEDPIFVQGDSGQEHENWWRPVGGYAQCGRLPFRSKLRACDSLERRPT